jgi:hypothetical protein
MIFLGRTQLENSTKKRGRPRIYQDAAERQKAYRARKRENGFREVKIFIRDVRDAEAPLESDIIDLSAIRQPNQGSSPRRCPPE